MAGNNVPLQQVQDGPANRAQQSAAQSVNTINQTLAGQPFATGQLISQHLSSGNNTITTKLGKKWTGYLILFADAAATTFGFSTSDDTKYIGINSSAACNAKIWVF